MNCLCCGKPIKSQTGVFNGWHRTCIRRFFGTSVMPEIHISSETLELLATETTSKGYTVPGVQKKLSLHLSMEEKARLTLVGYPSRLYSQTADAGIPRLAGGGADGDVHG